MIDWYFVRFGLAIEYIFYWPLLHDNDHVLSPVKFENVDK